MSRLIYKALDSVFRKLEKAHTQFLLSKAKCGENVSVRDRVTIYCPERLVLKNNVSINTGVTILAQGGVTIGEFAMIAPGVSIISVNHDYTKIGIEAHKTHIKNHVTIGPNTWLAAGCIILPGVTVGEGAVVAAGSVVTRDVEPYTVVGGIPAVEIKKRIVDNE